ncbi:Gfo/Idh/MocA family oxidoreductase [Candidatus Pelagibacter sp.]|nr:Gfo/Idh/MocA family oxidoreductase [Candidatus Pelagibacter sp.]
MINIALIGLGRIGQMHGKNLLLHNDFKLKYVFDLDKKLTNRIAKKFLSSGINNPKIAFNDKEIDVIFIASSTSTHIKLIEEAVKYKKVIFCEKPLDLSIEKINNCKKKIKNLKPKIQLGFNRRYDPGHYSLKKDLNKGIIGRLEKIIITSRDPSPPSIKYLKVSGGIFKDMMIHDFDLLRFYLDKDELDSIFSTATNMSDKRFDKINDYELASCILNSKSGVQCIITNSRHCSFGYDQRVELFGSKGMLISGNKNLNETEVYTKSNTAQKKPLQYFFIERYKEAYSLQLNDLSKFVKKNLKPLSSFEDGRRALIVANAASLSLKQKKQIKLKF